MLGHHLAEPLSDFVHCLLIGNLFPFVFTPFADSLQRYLESVSVIVYIRSGNSFVADICGEHGVVMGNDSFYFPIGNFGTQLTANVTDRTNRIGGVARFAHYAFLRKWVRSGLLFCEISCVVSAFNTPGFSWPSLPVISIRVFPQRDSALR